MHAGHIGALTVAAQDEGRPRAHDLAFAAKLEDHADVLIGIIQKAQRAGKLR